MREAQNEQRNGGSEQNFGSRISPGLRRRVLLSKSLSYLATETAKHALFRVTCQWMKRAKSDLMRILLCDPVPDLPLEQVERKLAAAQDLVVKGADVEFLGELLFGV